MGAQATTRAMNPPKQEHPARKRGAVLLGFCAALASMSAACGTATPPAQPPARMPKSEGSFSGAAIVSRVPLTRPEGWDPVAFNRVRGNAGAVPESYRDAINAEDADTQALGMHLPYVPVIERGRVPSGFLPLMWGDPAQVHPPHPHARRSPANQNQGEWFDWIRLRKATSNEAQEAESTYSNWPRTGIGDTGDYLALRGQNPAAEEGRNTIYLVALPKDARAGDLLRVWGHCILHGEYVHFLPLR